MGLLSPACPRSRNTCRHKGQACRCAAALLACRLPKALPSQGSSWPWSSTMRMSKNTCGRPCFSFSCTRPSPSRPVRLACRRGCGRCAWWSGGGGVTNQARCHAKGMHGSYRHGSGFGCGVQFPRGGKSATRLDGADRARWAELGHAPQLPHLHALPLEKLNNAPAGKRQSRQHRPSTAEGALDAWPMSSKRLPARRQQTPGWQKASRHLPRFPAAAGTRQAGEPTAYSPSHPRTWGRQRRPQPASSGRRGAAAAAPCAPAGPATPWARPAHGARQAGGNQVGIGRHAGMFIGKARDKAKAQARQ